MRTGSDKFVNIFQTPARHFERLRAVCEYLRIIKNDVAREGTYRGVCIHKIIIFFLTNATKRNDVSAHTANRGIYCKTQFCGRDIL
jgi:hypothetical protein